MTVESVRLSLLERALRLHRSLNAMDLDTAVAALPNDSGSKHRERSKPNSGGQCKWKTMENQQVIIQME
jgi:hypothetical protein